MVQKYAPYSEAEIAEMRASGSGVRTGFDELLEQKAKNIEIVRKLKLGNPYITRNEIRDKTGLSLRSITRYMGIITKAYKKGYIKNHWELLVEERQQRVKKLKQLIFKHPDWTNEHYGREIGVAARKIAEYKKELRK